MGLFEMSDPETFNQLDWKILKNGAISIYLKPNILEEACTWFHEHNYRLYFFDCTQWKTQEDFYDAARKVLNLPDYFAGNLDSFNDCLYSVDILKKDDVVIIFSRFDVFWQRWRIFSAEILDIFERHSRYFLLSGRHLIVLIQSDHPNISFQPLGARPVLLNPGDRLIKIREIWARRKNSR